MRRRLIVGIDPGTTTAIALLSFSGEVVLLLSRKGLTDAEIEKIVLEKGKPVIVATDVARPPERVKRLASQLGALLFTPPENISKREKEEVARTYGLKDDHARDALVAALTAYGAVKEKIERVRKRLCDEGFLEEMAERVIRGEQLAQAVRVIMEPEERPRKGKRVRESEEIKRLRKRVGELSEKVRRLERALEKERRKRNNLTRGVALGLMEERLLRLEADRERLREEVVRLNKELRTVRKRLRWAEAVLGKIEEGVRGGLVVGRKGEVEGVELLPGVVLGRKKDAKERLKELLMEYREERRKELNVL